ncbi:related to 1-phosphatidylinositol 3-phosphate 5-kinase FAB1 [Saccharomycodes ludwigii]|uniref:1-phosphatidylinositol-3-phosphate 5-kinase n=1 Tax=Saccharomycodes ludwigii TaxID=36035 RepID=A0A376B0N8_9ASCO|nr:related to 1-phosphatidylinositol 3-phosphate 5-kinase FAB1 [Saccharomycodes ludwigii]
MNRDIPINKTLTSNNTKGKSPSLVNKNLPLISSTTIGLDKKPVLSSLKLPLDPDNSDNETKHDTVTTKNMGNNKNNTEEEKNDVIRSPVTTSNDNTQSISINTAARGKEQKEFTQPRHIKGTLHTKTTDLTCAPEIDKSLDLPISKIPALEPLGTTGSVDFRSVKPIDSKRVNDNNIKGKTFNQIIDYPHSISHITNPVDSTSTSPLLKKRSSLTDDDFNLPDLENTNYKNPTQITWLNGPNAVQRSSIYESKSSVTAIPIRTSSHKKNSAYTNYSENNTANNLSNNNYNNNYNNNNYNNNNYNNNYNSNNNNNNNNNNNSNFNYYNKHRKSVDYDDLTSTNSMSSSLTASFSKNFLHRFYKNKKNKKRKGHIGLLAKEYWMKDENCKECFHCGKSFNTFRRKHHCRICGQIFCSNCTFLIRADKFGYEGKIRLCKTCWEHCENDYFDDSSDEDISYHDSGSTDDQIDVSPEQHVVLQPTISQQRLDDKISGLDNYNANNLDFHDGSININNGNSTDVVSLFGADDSRLLIGSISPPPKMTIPATRQGEALEIPFLDVNPLQMDNGNTNNNDNSDIGIFNNNNNIGNSNTSDNVNYNNNDKEFYNIDHSEFSSSNNRNRTKMNTKDTCSLKDVDLMPSIDNHRRSSTFSSPSQNKPMLSLLNKQLNFIGGIHNVTKNIIGENNTNTPKNENNNVYHPHHPHHPYPYSNVHFNHHNTIESVLYQPQDHSSVKAKLTNGNFKFEFNYRLNNLHNYLTQGERNNSRNSDIHNYNNHKDMSPDIKNGYPKTPDLHRVSSELSLSKANKSKSYDTTNILHTEKNDSKGSSSEDEGSMSIYTTLNDTHHIDPIQYNGLPRNLIKSSQRAQASLQRMRTRRKSKSKSNSFVNRKDMSIFSYSAPNLFSILSTTDNNNNNSLGNSTHGVVSNRNIKPNAITTANKISTSEANLRSKNENLTRDLRRAISSSLNSKNRGTDLKSTLNQVSIQHVKALMIQVLNDQRDIDVDEWIKVISPILLTLEQIHVDAKNSGNLDFRQYIKIKRIPGGEISDSKLVNGIVFSKNNTLKSMPRLVKRPRILILMFPLDYQKSESKLLSLDTVMAQEKEYLNKLVLRIKNLNPDVIFVGANVSGYALNLLHRSGIVVQFNLKPQVLERIARLSEADVAISVDKLSSNIKLGICEYFELKSFIYGNICKTYTFLSGCNPSLGGTIVLRGLDNSILRNIKDTVEFLVYVVFTLKLESSLLKDDFIEVFAAIYDKYMLQKQQSKATGYFSGFIDKFNQRILSVSPSIEFPMPFLLHRARELENELISKIQIRNNIQHMVSDEELIEFVENNEYLKTISSFSRIQKKDLKHIIEFIQDKEIAHLDEKFEVRKRQWEFFFSLSYNMLGTGSHQSMTVLYSMVSNKTGTPCIGPQLVTIDYFWDNDITIGQFIENVVATANFPCTGGCGGVVLDHYRSYVHGTGKVDVMIEKFQSRLPALKNIILIWSYCKKCKISSPILQMSEKSWNYSFGKYLELIFWSIPEVMGGLGNCMHDVTKEHVKYFGLNDIVVRMDYSPIDIHELITPGNKITWKPNSDIKIKFELQEKVLCKINDFYQSVMSRLNRVKLDGNTQEDIMEQGTKRVEKLKAVAREEKQQLLEMYDEIMKTTSSDNHLGLNAVIRSLHDYSVEWINEFADFEKKYLPSEKDIARITAFQLKKLFGDNFKTEDKALEKKSIALAEKTREKQSKQHENGSIESDPSAALMEKSETTREQKCNELTSKKNEYKDENDKKDERGFKQDEDAKLSELNKSSSSIPDNGLDSAAGENGLFVHPEKFADKQSALPENRLILNKNNTSNTITTTTNNSKNDVINKSRDNNTNNVGKLASFFDQMYFDALSKEFEHQRELERLQINKRNYKALRTETSKPIVEIYQDVKDAVDEPLHVSASSTISSNENFKIANKNGGDKGRPNISNNISTNNVNSPIQENGTVEKSSESTALQRSIHKWEETLVHQRGEGECPTFDVRDHVTAPDSYSKEQMMQENDTEGSISETKSKTTATENSHNTEIDSKNNTAESSNEEDDTSDDKESPQQHEKTSLLNILSNFWADRSATLWKPLAYPLETNEHIFIDSNVIIRDDEPTSLIAFCLSTADYLQKLKKTYTNSGVNADGESSGKEKQTKKEEPKNASGMETDTTTVDHHEKDVKSDQINDENSVILDQMEKSNETLSRKNPGNNGGTINNDTNLQNALNLEQENNINNNDNTNTTTPDINNNNNNNNTAPPQNDPLLLESILTKQTAMHLRYQFQDGTVVMSCKIFFAEQFDAFRKACGCADNFIQSLSRCVKWDSSGGKSGSAFLKTLDDRLIIKELSHSELDAFTRFAPNYFQYMSQAMFHDLPTALAKILGFYQIQIKNTNTGKTFKKDVLLMENLFYEKKTSRIFDLKGSMRNRHVEQTGKENEVLLDENMVEYIYESPIFVREYDKKLLRASLWNDTLFLAKMNVMDYSLVIGIDDENHKLTVGIIDCIRTFTWDKKLESWVKEKGFVGNSTKEPTIVTPRQYKNRFREAMERYILVVPDPWYRENSNQQQAK